MVLFGRWIVLKGMKKTSSASCLHAHPLVQGASENSTLGQKGSTLNPPSLWVKHPSWRTSTLSGYCCNMFFMCDWCRHPHWPIRTEINHWSKFLIKCLWNLTFNYSISIMQRRFFKCHNMVSEILCLSLKPWPLVKDLYKANQFKMDRSISPVFYIIQIWGVILIVVPSLVWFFYCLKNTE